MSAQVLTLEELRDALERARSEADAADVALANVTDETTEDVLVELDAKYKQSLTEVKKLAGSIERKEQMNEVLAAVPHGDNKKRGALGLVINEPATYRRTGQFSFFKDIFNSSFGDPGAQARIRRHTEEMKVQQAQMESYAMTTASGSGIGFVPPQYLQEEWAALARAGRPLADAIGSRPLPDAGVSFNIPRVTTGGTAAVQASEGGAVQDNSQVTDDVTLAISTIAAKTDMSRQAFDRSQPGLDDVIGADLAAAYALQVDSEIINGPGSGGRVKGILTAAASNAITATATAVGIYPKVADATQRIDTGRFLPANLCVMHPRRWAQFLGTLDGQSRPLVVPDPQAVNAMAQGGGGTPPSQGLVGYNLQGLPVLKDPNIPTNLGTNTNEDRIIITRREDLYLFEAGAPVIRVFEEVLSGTLQVRILAFGYIAFTAERYVTATYLITGLTPPTF